MIKEMYDRIIYWKNADRIGPDIPMGHCKLYFRSSMIKLCKKKFLYFADSAEVRPGAYIVGCSQISIGNNVVIRPGVQMHGESDTLKCTIIIEDDVLIGSGVHFYVENHNFSNPSIPIYYQGHSPAQPIIVKKGAWIGANAIILPGVEIGENAVIAAGAVVTNSIDPKVIVGGIPARKIRSIGDF